jgi:hypothetical protein
VCGELRQERALVRASALDIVADVLSTNGHRNRCGDGDNWSEQ